MKNKYILLFLLGFIVFNPLSAQTDSLLKVSSNASLHDTVRADACFQFALSLSEDQKTLAFKTIDDGIDILKHGKMKGATQERWICLGEVAKGDWFWQNHRVDTAIVIYKLALEKVKAPENRKFLADQYVLTSYKLIQNDGKFEEGANLNSEALEIYSALKDSVGIGQAYNNIGYMYQQMGIIDLSLDFFYKSLLTREAISDYSGLGETYTNLSGVYAGINELDTAIHFADLAFQNRTKAGSLDGISKAINTKGTYLQMAGRYDEAMACFRMGLSLTWKKSKEHNARVLFNIGFVHKLQGHLDSAKYYYNRALDAGIENEDVYAQMYSLNGMANFALDENRIEDALKYATNAYDIATKKGLLKEIKAASLTLSKVYTRNKDFEKALFYTNEYYKYKDSLNNTANQKSIFQKESKFEFEKKMIASKKEQELKDAETDANARRQKLIIIFTIISLVIVALFAVFLFNRFRVTQRQKKEIELQKHIVEEKQKEILDSIHYAKRIQKSMMPTEKYIDKQLRKNRVN